jgi:gas vesicle protein
MKTNNIILGVVSGLAVGAILGVLFAPEKGETTRKKIATKGSDLADNLKSQFDDLASKFSKKAEKVADDSQEIFETATEKLTDIKKEVTRM